MVKKPNYTQVPNDIIDIYMQELSGAELKVILLITRKTIGWAKETDGISISQMEKITGLSNRAIITAVKSLEQKKLIKCTRNIRKTSIYQLWVDEVSSQGKNVDMKKVHKPSEESSQDEGKSSEESSQTKESNINKLNKEQEKADALLPIKKINRNKREWHQYNQNGKSLSDMKKWVIEDLTLNPKDPYIIYPNEENIMKIIIDSMRKEDDTFDGDRFGDKWEKYLRLKTEYKKTFIDFYYKLNKL